MIDIAGNGFHKGGNACTHEDTILGFGVFRGLRIDFRAEGQSQFLLLKFGQVYNMKTIWLQDLEYWVPYLS